MLKLREIFSELIIKALDSGSFKAAFEFKMQFFLLHPVLAIVQLGWFLKYQLDSDNIWMQSELLLAIVL